VVNAYVRRMPDIDLPPGDYRERKPAGWRWRLPWSHPEDNKLHAAMLAVMLFGLGYVFLGRDQLTSDILFGITAVLAAVAGIMFGHIARD
jgi:hypothetical protein